MTGVTDLLETATNGSSSFQSGAGSRYRYGVYGMVISSDTPLDLPSDTHGGMARVECVSAPALAFLAATETGGDDGDTDSWYRYVVLRDGSTYVRWRTIGEFLVAADGRRIMFRRFDRASLESFQVYLLGQALSFALVRQGFEPLHATAVVVDRRTVAFLGSNAFGKSSLAACFLEAGARLLTDDLLILRESGNRILAYPGPPRLKLFPKIARRFLGQDGANRVHMNPDTDKLILPIEEHRRGQNAGVGPGSVAIALGDDLRFAQRTVVRVVDVRGGQVEHGRAGIADHGVIRGEDLRERAIVLHDVADEVQRLPRDGQVDARLHVVGERAVEVASDGEVRLVERVQRASVVAQRSIRQEEVVPDPQELKNRERRERWKAQRPRCLLPVGGSWL